MTHIVLVVYYRDGSMDPKVYISEADIATFAALLADALTEFPSASIKIFIGGDYIRTINE